MFLMGWPLRTALVALLLPASAAAQTPQTRTRPPAAAASAPSPTPQIPTGTGTISGIIKNASDESALARARVTASTDALPEARVTISDAAGRYSFADLPPGEYVVSVTRSGFAPQVYGQSRVSDGKPVAVANGKTVSGIDVALTQGAVIAGRILDEDGTPFAGALVDALIARTQNGSDVLVSVSTSYTDDRGEYRLFGLPPGQYYVSAADPAFRAISTPKGVLHYSPTYYPGVVFADQAKPLLVSDKGTAPRADFTLKLVPPARVTGQIATYDHKQLLSGAVMMSPLEGEGVPMAPPEDIAIQADGRFAFGEVVPGRYQIRARGQTEPAGNALFAVFSVVVDGHDVDNIAMTLQPGALLDGQILFESKHGNRPPAPSALHVRAPFVDGNTFGDAITGSVQADGTYAIHGIMNGPHQLTVEGLTPPWTIKDIDYRGNSITDLALDVQQHEVYHDVRIVITDDGSVVSGTVVNRRQVPVANVGVLVFPRAPLFWMRTNRRLRVAYTDDAGHFTVLGLPAGEYLAVASFTVDPSDLGKHDRLAELETMARAFMLPVDNGRVTVDLSLSNTGPINPPVVHR